LKIAKAERGRGMAQVVELLPSKGEALNLNPSIMKEKKVLELLNHTKLLVLQMRKLRSREI
jgi:hypothetical protein